MPTIAIVAGVKITIYYSDHPPPHFHIEFAEHKGQIAIRTAELLEGSLPASKLAAVKSWAEGRRTELMECWDKARRNENPGKVE